MLALMRRRIPLKVALLAGGVLLAAPPSALAQPGPSATAVKMAQDLVEQGRVLGQQGKWGDALERFQRASALALRTSPQLAFYVGYAESRVGKLVAAEVDLRRAIDLARSASNDSVAKAAQAELPDVEARTPTLTITVNGTATPVALQVDGAALSVAAVGSPAPLDPGEHSVVVQFANGGVTKHVALVERQHLTLPIDPSEGASIVSSPTPADKPVVPAKPVAPNVNPPATPEPSDGSGRRIASLALVGVGGAALVTGGIFYLLSRSALSSVTTQCGGMSQCDVPSTSPIRSDYQDAQRDQTISIVLASAGAAFAATGLVLFATGKPSATQGTSAATARVTPWVGLGAGGASLSGSF
jgi:hypothetical protein